MWSFCGIGVSTAVVTMPAILLTGTRATVFVVVSLLRPTVAVIVAIGIMQATTQYFSRCWGKFFPGIVPLRLKQFSDRWPGFLQFEQVTTAEGVDVFTIAYSRTFAFREGPFRIAHFAYILRIALSARSSVTSSSASALYIMCRYSSVSPSSTISSMLSSLNTIPHIY